MNNKAFKFLAVFAALTIVISVVSINNIMASTSYQIDSNMNVIMDKVAEMSAKQSPEMMSSNPYDYIKDNSNYEKIVALGLDALPIIKDKLDKTNENGLREYILAIAAEEIAKVDLKNNTYNWINGKEWLNEWNKLLRFIPENVDIITSGTLDNNAKNAALSKLGVAAVPYIMDKIAAGETEYTPSLSNLIKDDSIATLSETEKAGTTSVGQWVNDNRSKYENLRNMVEETRK